METKKDLVKIDFSFYAYPKYWKQVRKHLNKSEIIMLQEIVEISYYKQTKPNLIILSKYSGEDKANINRTLKSLLDKKLIKKTKNNENKDYYYSITPEEEILKIIESTLTKISDKKQLQRNCKKVDLTTGKMMSNSQNDYDMVCIRLLDRSHFNISTNLQTLTQSNFEGCLQQTLDSFYTRNNKEVYILYKKTPSYKIHLTIDYPTDDWISNSPVPWIVAGLVIRDKNKYRAIRKVVQKMINDTVKRIDEEEENKIKEKDRNIFKKYNYEIFNCFNENEKIELLNEIIQFNKNNEVAEENLIKMLIDKESYVILFYIFLDFVAIILENYFNYIISEESKNKVKNKFMSKDFEVKM